MKVCSTGVSLSIPGKQQARRVGGQQPQRGKWKGSVVAKKPPKNAANQASEELQAWLHSKRENRNTQFLLEFNYEVVV